MTVKLEEGLHVIDDCAMLLVDGNRIHVFSGKDFDSKVRDGLKLIGHPDFPLSADTFLDKAPIDTEEEFFNTSFEELLDMVVE